MELRSFILLTIVYLAIWTKPVVETNVHVEKVHDEVAKLVAEFWYNEIDNMQNCSYDILRNSLRAINYLHPDLSELGTIGTSVQGRELWNLKLTNTSISQYNSKREKVFFKKQIKYVGNINGYSGPACVTLVKLAKYLVKDIAVSDDAYVFNFTEIHIVPNLNPDGYEKSIPGDCKSLAGRPNGNDTNLNTNFPDVNNEADPLEDLEWIWEQPETAAVRRWIEKNNFVLSASLTSGTTKILFPWSHAPGYVPEGEPFDVPAPDAEGFFALCDPYIRSLKEADYKFGCDRETKMDTHCMNAAEGTRISGSMMDYNYKHGVQEMMIGLGCCINENRAVVLNEIFHNHSQPLFHMIIDTIFSYRRRVVDGNTGKPLWKAKIVPIAVGEHIFEEHQRTTPLYTDREGIFGRVFAEGIYMLKITYREYKDEVLKVEIPSHPPATIEGETIKIYRSEGLPQGESFVDVEATKGNKNKALFAVKEILESFKPTGTQWYNGTMEVENASTKPPNKTAPAHSPNGAASLLGLPNLFKTAALILFCLCFSNKLLLG